MPASNFKFVSPGVFVNEIDSSQLPRQAEDIGPVVIGRALKGPMMRPVKLESFSDFEQIFGLPVAGGVNNDVWREGNKLAPTYGAFAAEAYLKNAGPLTFVRLGGYQNGEAIDQGYAGWQTEKVTLNTTNALQNGGAFGLFVAAVSGTNNPQLLNNGSAKLAAVIYVDKGTLTLSGSSLSGSTAVNAAGTWVKSATGNTQQFTLSFSGSSGVEKKVVDFTAGSKLFIRDVLNTNPTKTNDALLDNPEMYWLGQTFENSLPAGTNYVGAIVALSNINGSTQYSGGNFRKGAEKAKTPWVFAQHKGDKSEWINSVNSEVPSQELFRFETLSEDEHAQNNLKISIEDIKLPASKYVKFGTFAVVIRSMQDTDDKRVVLERFDGCNLDASSPDYIGKKIGDRYVEWDYDDRRFKEFGLYDNKSKYIRVEMNTDVEAGVTDTDLLPFGYAGPLKYKGISQFSVAANTAYPITGSQSFLETHFTGALDQAGLIANYAFTASLNIPGLSAVESTGSYHIKRIKDIYWGMKTTNGDTTKFNKETTEYLRALPVNVPAATLEPSFVFSLDDISGSFDTVKNAYTNVAWGLGKRKTGDSITSIISNEEEWSRFLKTFNKFTMPLVGGFEGLDITEKEPFNNRVDGALDGRDEQNSYAINSLNVAIDMVSDPEVVEMNALVVPGVKEPSIHNKMISTCETRGDALAIVDIQGDFVSPFEGKFSDKNELLPVVSEATAYVKDTLTVNSSYGCTYYPWVQINDIHSGNKVFMPPSVVALGTFGSTKRFSEIWFAPAGFTRGGLSDAQAGGLPVIGITKQLNSKDRDALYEAGINPIAKFPHEGIVIFGQKTLQATPSALDRVNVRRLMNYVKKEISRMASTVLFDPNVEVTWNRFLSQAEPFLATVKSRLGLTDFRVVLDETTTTPDLVDRNIVYAKILLKPARAIEYIALDFNITNSGASFGD
jgi:hypothetical protein